MAVLRCFNTAAKLDAKSGPAAAAAPAPAAAAPTPAAAAVLTLLLLAGGEPSCADRS